MTLNGFINDCVDFAKAICELSPFEETILRLRLNAEFDEPVGNISETEAEEMWHEHFKMLTHEILGMILEPENYTEEEMRYCLIDCIAR